MTPKKKRKKEKKVLITTTLPFIHWLHNKWPHHLLLLPHLHNLPMWIRVQFAGECRTIRRPILRHQPTRLVSHPASITQRFRPIWTCPPLRGLFNTTMLTFSPHFCYWHSWFSPCRIFPTPPALLLSDFSRAPVATLAASLDRHAKATVTHNNATITAIPTDASAASGTVFKNGDWAVVLGNAAWLLGENAEAGFHCWESIFIR